MSRTPLHDAAEEPDGIRLVNFLAEAGPDGRPWDLECRDERGNTPLHLAAYSGAADNVEHLLSAGANVDALNGAHWTPLHCAAIRNLVDVATILIDFEADINLSNKDGYTPLAFFADDVDAEAMAARAAQIAKSAQGRGTPSPRATGQDEYDAVLDVLNSASRGVQVYSPRRRDPQRSARQDALFDGPEPEGDGSLDDAFPEDNAPVAAADEAAFDRLTGLPAFIPLGVPAKPQRGQLSTANSEHGSENGDDDFASAAAKADVDRMLGRGGSGPTGPATTATTATAPTFTSTESVKYGRQVETGGTTVSDAHLEADEDVAALAGEYDKWSSMFRRSLLHDFFDMKQRLLQRYHSDVAAEHARHKAEVADLSAEVTRLQNIEVVSTDRQAEARDEAAGLEAQITQLVTEAADTSVAHARALEAQEAAFREQQIEMLHKARSERALRAAMAAWKDRTNEAQRRKFNAVCEARVDEACQIMQSQHQEELAAMAARVEAAEEAARMAISERNRFEEEMKKSFMRGVCALNMEAMTMFKAQYEAVMGGMAVGGENFDPAAMAALVGGGGGGNVPFIPGPGDSTHAQDRAARLNARTAPPTAENYSNRPEVSARTQSHREAIGNPIVNGPPDARRVPVRTKVNQRGSAHTSHGSTTRHKKKVLVEKYSVDANPDRRPPRGYRPVPGAAPVEQRPRRSASRR